MSRGGKREGAGRKKGSLNQKTQEIMAKAADEGILPLEVMLSAMRSAWSAGDVASAVKHAVDAAPYMHPRLQSTKHSGDAENPIHSRSVIEQRIVDAAGSNADHSDGRSEETRTSH